jgi:hypothetical protein
MGLRHFLVFISIVKMSQELDIGRKTDLIDQLKQLPTITSRAVANKPKLRRIKHMMKSLKCENHVFHAF